MRAIDKLMLALLVIGLTLGGAAFFGGPKVVIGVLLLGLIGSWIMARREE